MEGSSKVVLISIVFLTMVLISGFIYSFASADGTPVPPHNFYGSLTINGAPAQTGIGVKGFIDGEDRTFNGPYFTEKVGEYGSINILYTKFQINGTSDDSGKTITFKVETSPGSGTFVNADQTATFDPGADTQLDLTATFAESCTNGQTRPCPLQQGVCSGSNETCIGSQWPGCSASNYGVDYENPETSCDNKDNDCDGSVDESITKSCGSGSCSGSQICSLGNWSTCSSSGSDCGVCAICDSVGSCVYDGTQDNDCNPFDISGIATCDWIPDSIHYTWDYRPAFDSECSGIDTCTQGSETIAHACSISSCGAECEENNDCAATDCDYLDGCYSGKYYDCFDVDNTCESCACTDNSCPSYSSCPQTDTDSDGDGYDNLCEECDYEPVLQTPNEPGTELTCTDNTDNDCDGLTDCEDSDCFEDESCQEDEYCILITEARLLNSSFHEVTEIKPGAMYHIEVHNRNICEDPITSMQIIQVSRGLTPINIGTVTSTINSEAISVVTVGFVLPANAYSGETFTADIFNWNHWIDQNPSTFEILSEPESIVFQAE